LRILNYGAGVNSTALLVLVAQGKLEADLAIFADTGAEHPETYQYIEEVAKPLCEKIGLPFVTVRNKETLYERFWRLKTIPLRRFRSCTAQHKIRPIGRYLKEHYPNTDIVRIIGIDYGEKRRIKQYPNEKREDPLAKLKMSRRACKELIKNFGLPIPIKSGCYLCPFQNLKAWKALYRKHPDLYLKAEELEKNGLFYPKVSFIRARHNLTLEQIRIGMEQQTSLEAFEGEGNEEE